MDPLIKSQLLYQLSYGVNVRWMRLNAFVHGTERQIENKSFRARHLKSFIGDFKECEGKGNLGKSDKIFF